jgi:hypothetical protein
VEEKARTLYYYSSMRRFLFNLFNKTIGIFLRFCQRTLINFDLHSQTVSAELKKLALISSRDFVLQCGNMMVFQDRRSYWEYLIKHCPTSDTVLEFGVFKGQSIRYFADAMPSSKLYGFDSFSGLEEDWGVLINPREHSLSANYRRCLGMSNW